jgi:hypothetical protein
MASQAPGTAMSQLQELVRSTSARAVRSVAESPVRFSGRGLEPLTYDTDGWDAETLGYRLGTLAVAAVAVPYLLSESVLRRNWDGGGARGCVCLGLSLFAVGRITWGHVSEWPSVHRLGEVLLQTAGANRSTPERVSAPTREHDLPTPHFARELLPDTNGQLVAAAASAEAPVPVPVPVPVPQPQQQQQPEPEHEAASQQPPRSQTQARAASAAAETDRHPRVPSSTGVRSRSHVGARDGFDMPPPSTTDDDGIVEDLVAEERREAARKRRSRVRTYPLCCFHIVPSG